MLKPNKTESQGAAADKIAHTPGPWRIDCMSAERGLEIKGANGNTVIVEDDYFTFPDEMRCKDSVAEELAANARLIAAAPDYDEAAKLLRPVIGKFAISEGRVLVIGEDNKERLMTADESMKFHKGFSKLCAAISKAEGR